MDAERLIQFLFPKRCSFCGKVGSDPCENCKKHLKVIEGRICKKCGMPIGDLAYDICPRCQREKFFFERTVAIFYYEGVVRHGIHLFKYKSLYQNALMFSKLMVQKLIEHKFEFDLIVPVPISKTRFLERGYNHSLLLAKNISKEFQTMCYDILVRTKPTKPFYNLSKNERKKEIKGKIAIKNGYENIVKQKRILLIDDIFTTGVTANECAKVLKQAGAKQVIVCVLAITRLGV